MKIKFTLDDRSIWRSCSDFHIPISESGLQTWEEASKEVYTDTYQANEGVISVSIDWSNVLPALRHQVYLDLLPIDEYLDLFNRGLIHRKHITVSIEVDIINFTYRKPDAIYTLARYYSDLSLHRFFITMNIASPGSCDFWRSRITNTLDGSSNIIELSSTAFEGAWIYSLKNHLPPVKTIPYRVVVNWYNSLDIGQQQIARDRIQRVIFSLLHIAHDDSLNPTSLLWYSHALEALYATTNQQVSDCLRNRICALLDVPIAKRKHISKMINKFYGMRSDFVHGRMGIPHPLHIDGFDNNFDSYLTDLLECIDIGAYLIVISLQTLIENNWIGLDFSESISGITA